MEIQIRIDEFIDARGIVYYQYAIIDPEALYEIISYSKPYLTQEEALRAGRKYLKLYELKPDSIISFRGY